MSYMGVDLGTSGCRVIAIDEKGEIIASEKMSYQLKHGKNFFIELIPQDVLTAFEACVYKVNAKVKKDPVCSLSFSVIGEAFTPIGEDGKPLCNTLMPMDFRGLSEFSYIEEKFNKGKLYTITGQPLHPMQSLTKILWLKHNQQEIYQKTWKFLCWEDYLIYLFTGKPVIDFSLASRTMCFDIKKKQWSEEILDTFNINPSLFAQEEPIGTAIDYIMPKWSEKLGFKEKVIVISGGFDQSIAAIGGGVVKPGIVSDSIGTTECIGFILNKPIEENDLEAGYQNNCFIDDTYFINGGSLNGAVILNWLKENICLLKNKNGLSNTAEFFKIFENKLEYNPTRPIFFPYFSGSGTPKPNPNLKGGLFMLDLSVDIKDIFKSFLESSCFEVKKNIEWLENKFDEKINEIRAFGGGSQSNYWSQLKSHITCKHISKPKIQDAAVFGAAIVAMSGLKQSTLKDMVNDLVKVDKFYKPNFEISKLYQDKYLMYKIFTQYLENFKFEGKAQI